MLAAVSTEHKIGMLVVAGLFIVYALASSFVFPRYWPQFPGPRGRNAHIVGSVAFFVAMMLAVEFFAVEEEEAEAGAEHPAAAEPEPPPAEGGGGTVTVAGSEFKFELPSTQLEAGSYVFELENEGQVGHDLVVEGPGVEDAKTPVIDPGTTAEVEVELEPGSYELYCSVPGHREAGMETTVTVS